MKKQLLFTLVLIAILLLATGSAAAKATKTEFSYTLYICSQDTPEKEWSSGKPPDGQVYHWKGQGSIGRFISTEEGMEWWDGVVPAVSDGKIKLATSNGSMHAAFEKQFDNEFVTGTFAGSVVAHATAGVWHMWGGGHGTGDLEGWQYFADGIQLAKVPPGDPCPGGAINSYAMTAILIDTD